VNDSPKVEEVNQEAQTCYEKRTGPSGLVRFPPAPASIPLRQVIHLEMPRRPPTTHQTGYSRRPDAQASAQLGNMGNNPDAKPTLLRHRGAISLSLVIPMWGAEGPLASLNDVAGAIP
jgi:hypothetical protein